MGFIADEPLPPEKPKTYRPEDVVVVIGGVEIRPSAEDSGDIQIAPCNCRNPGLRDQCDGSCFRRMAFPV